MIRGTTLNASETYYNMKENENRLLEKYEERLLVEALQTGANVQGQLFILILVFALQDSRSKNTNKMFCITF